MLIDKYIVEDNGRSLTPSSETKLVLQNVDIHVSDVDRLSVTPAPGGDTFLTYFELVDHQWRMSDGQVRLPFPFVVANRHSIEALVHITNDARAQLVHEYSKSRDAHTLNEKLRGRISELESIIGVKEFLDDEPLDWEPNELSPKIQELLEKLGVQDW